MAVYCENCLNFTPGEKIPHPFGPPEWIKELCDAPENFKDSYRKISHIRISTPRIINKGGNCTWFVSSDISSSSSGDSVEEPESSSSSAN